MIQSVHFSVPFVHGKERPRFAGHTYTPKATKDREDAIRTAYEGASLRKYGRIVKAPAYTPVAVLVSCTTPAPKQRPKWFPKPLWDRLRGIPFVKVPDWDNVGKEITDALNGTAYHDDAQVTEAHVFKTLRKIGGQERTHVLVRWEA